MSPRLEQALALMLLLVLATPLPARAERNEEAARHFEAGERAVAAQRFGDAAREYAAAYELAPDYKVLYNLGTAYAVLGRPVEAISSLGRYLQEGGSRIDPERRAKVEREIEAQRALTGSIEVHVREPGAQVLVDTAPIGSAPLMTTVTVAAGNHVVSAELTGHKTARADLSVPQRGVVRFAPTLERLGPPPPPAAPERPPVPGRAQRIVGGIAAVMGAAGVAVGGALLYKGQAKHDDAVTRWNEAGATARAGQSAVADMQRAEAKRMEADSQDGKRIGGLVLGVGGAAIITGAVLLLTAPRFFSHARARISPWASASAAGLVLAQPL